MGRGGKRDRNQADTQRILQDTQAAVAPIATPDTALAPNALTWRLCPLLDLPEVGVVVPGLNAAPAITLQILTHCPGNSRQET